MNKKLFKYAAFFLLCIMIVVLFSKNARLEREISELSRRISVDYTRLSEQMSDIYDNVDKRMEEQASLLSKAEYTLHGLDSDVADVKVSVMPKTVSQGMRMALSVGDTNFELKKDKNGEFSATVPIDIFEGYEDFPLLTIYTQQTEQREYLHSIHLSYLWTKYLPQLDNAQLHASSAFAMNQLSIDGALDFSYKRAEQNPDAGFVKLELVTQVAGKEISRKDITAAAKENSEVPFNEKYTVEQGDVIVYLIAEDDLGFIHKKAVFSWYSNYESTASESAAMAGHSDEMILDKSGNILFSTY